MSICTRICQGTRTHAPRYARLLAVIVLCAEAESVAASTADLKAVCDYAASPKEVRVIDATAFLTRAAVHDPSTNTYSIETEPFGSSGPMPVCSDSMFYMIDHVPGNSGRTGFLIAPNLVMTAPHNNDFDYLGRLVVFRPMTGTYG